MEEKLNSEGKCLFCNETFKKASISKHLIKELQDKEKSGKEKNGNSFLIKVEPNKKYYGANGFFLYLWMNDNDTMEDVDDYLRTLWLECCGHISAFRIPRSANRGIGMFDTMDAFDFLEQGNIKKYEEIMEESMGEVPMSRKIKDVFHTNLVLEYEYDFGSSTYLILTVIEEFSIAANNKEVLLSRNEPLEIYCSECKKEPAVKLCSVDDKAFCSKCAKKHAKKCEDFADYAAMPVVNSPRMGVCGYEGGTIDQERDGIFIKK